MQTSWNNRENGDRGQHINSNRYRKGCKHHSNGILKTWEGIARILCCNGRKII